MNKVYILIIILVPLCLWGQNRVIEIDYGLQPKPVYTFWNSTGFSPADIVMTNEMKCVLRDIGKFPKKGINYIRPHYLLNLVEAKGMANGSPTYNWSKLDAVLDEINRNGLMLIFELMGYPSDGSDTSASQYDKNFQEQLTHRTTYFDNLQNAIQINLWKLFVKDLALHLESRYGKSEIRAWFFETSNEPDLPHFWKYDVNTFLNYYDACSEGLKEADGEIVFGGPGTARDLNDTYKALLAHCDKGKNYFTGETGVRIDFVSTHIKDLPRNMAKRELRLFDYIKSNHPGFIHKPFINDEADPIAGWATPYWWEQGPWYAAFVAQNIDVHQRIVIDSAKVNYRLLSNDHTFMGNWDQRTTHALFQNQKTADAFVLIKKPVLNVMELIAGLGDQYVDVTIPDEISSYFGVLPTRKNDTLIILVYNRTTIEINYQEKTPNPEPDSEFGRMAQEKVTAQLHIKGIGQKRFCVKEYRLDEEHANPHHEWEKMGKPQILSDDQIMKLKNSEKPVLVRNESINCTDDIYSYNLISPSPSVSLIMIIPTTTGQ